MYSKCTFFLSGLSASSVYWNNYGHLIKENINNCQLKNGYFFSGSLCLNFFHLLARKPNLEKFIQINSFIILLVRIQFYLSRVSGKWVSTKTALAKALMENNQSLVDNYWFSSPKKAVIVYYFYNYKTKHTSFENLCAVSV